MLTSPEITAEIRRKTIRDLADISAATFVDDDIDARVENADAIALTYFQVADPAALTGDEPFFRNMITVSNLITSALIRQGLGGIDNTRVAKHLSLIHI